MHHGSEPGGTSKKKYNLPECIQLTNPWKSSGPSLTLHIPKRRNTFPTAKTKIRRRGTNDPQDCPPWLNFCLELKQIILTIPKHTILSLFILPF